MANYVVMVRFDEATEQKILCLQEKLVANGYQSAINEWPPHITIAAYEDADEQGLLQWTEEYTARQHSFRLGLLSLNILPLGGERTDTAVVALNPSHSKTLVDFYYGFHEKYEEYCTGIGWFNSIGHDNPIMHSTIGVFDVATMQEALEVIFASGVFGYTEITALELYTYPMRLIGRFELRLEE